MSLVDDIGALGSPEGDPFLRQIVADAHLDASTLDGAEVQVVAYGDPSPKATTTQHPERTNVGPGDEPAALPRREPGATLASILSNHAETMQYHVRHITEAGGELSIADITAKDVLTGFWMRLRISHHTHPVAQMPEYKPRKRDINVN